MKAIVKLHNKPHWYEAFQVNNKWHIEVDGVVTPVTQVCISSWSYLNSRSVIVPEYVGGKLCESFKISEECLPLCAVPRQRKVTRPESFIPQLSGSFSGGAA